MTEKEHSTQTLQYATHNTIWIEILYNFVVKQSLPQLNVTNIAFFHKLRPSLRELGVHHRSRGRAVGPLYGARRRRRRPGPSRTVTGRTRRDYAVDRRRRRTTHSLARAARRPGAPRPAGRVAGAAPRSRKDSHTYLTVATLTRRRDDESPP
jgi:hypothetical protein